MRKISTLILVLLGLFGISCSHHKYPRELIIADSLTEVRPDSAMMLLKSLHSKINKASEDIKMYYDLLTIKAEDKSFVTHQSDKKILSIVNYYENGGDKTLLPSAYYYAGRVYSDMQDAPRALDYYQRSLDAMKDRKNASLMGKIFSQMGHLYIYQNLYDDAIIMFKKAYLNSFAMNDTINMVYDLSDIASGYTSKKEDNLSLKYLIKAHQLAQLTNDSLVVSSVEIYMAMHYCYMNKGDLAKKYIQSSLKNVESQNASEIYSATAYIYMSQGQMDSATYYYNKVKNVGTIYAKEAAYKFFARKGIARIGDKDVLKDFDTYNNYIDSVRSATSTEALAKASALYNYQLREVENARLEKANSRMHAIVIIACLATLVLLLCSLALLQYYRHRRMRMQMQMERLKQIKEIIYKKSNEYISDNKRKIAELELLLKTTDLENEELKKKLQNERIRLISENEIAEIRNSESRLAYERIVKTDVFRRFNSLLSSGNIKNPNVEDWDELKELIDKEYPGFTEKIISLCNINTHEFHVCLLLKINIPLFQISLLTNHTKTSISATRRRLYAKAFGKQAHPEDWDNFIRTL